MSHVTRTNRFPVRPFCAPAGYSPSWLPPHIQSFLLHPLLLRLQLVRILPTHPTHKQLLALPSARVTTHLTGPTWLWSGQGLLLWEGGGGIRRPITLNDRMLGTVIVSQHSNNIIIAKWYLSDACPSVLCIHKSATTSEVRTMYHSTQVGQKLTFTRHNCRLEITQRDRHKITITL